MITGLGSFYINNLEVCTSDATLEINIQKINNKVRTPIQKRAQSQFANRTGVEYILNLTTAELNTVLQLDLVDQAGGQNYITYSGAPDILADKSAQISPTIWLNFFENHISGAPIEPAILNFAGVFILPNSKIYLKSQIFLLDSAPVAIDLISYQFSCFEPTILQLN